MVAIPKGRLHLSRFRKEEIKVATRVKEKAINHRENNDVRPRATARYIRMSPRKVKMVID